MEAKCNSDNSRRYAKADEHSSSSDNESGPKVISEHEENCHGSISQGSSKHNVPQTVNIHTERGNKNRTDDDKIHADKIAYKVQSDAIQLHYNQMSRESPNTSNSDEEISPRSKLPDLIPNISPNSLTPTMDTENRSDTEYSDSTPPLPESRPPDLQRSLSSPPVLQSAGTPPPPLPTSSPPPMVNVKSDKYDNILTDETFVEGDDSECEEYEKHVPPGLTKLDHNGLSDTSFQKKEEREHLLSDYDSDTTMENESEHEEFQENEQNTEFDIDNEIQVINTGPADQPHGVDNVVVPDQTDLSTAEQTFLSLLSEFENKDKSDTSMDFDDEFEAIFNSINASSSNQDPYHGRFAGRRDKYGFILSPIVESPSPTPSCMSGYSGLSSASPDMFSMFRVSPAPRAGKRELDLSSLSKSVSEWEAIEEEQTVPIYHTRQKLELNIPDSTGWDSGDDLLTPTSATEWDVTPSGLSTPPAYLKSLQQPDNIIFEENESSSAECDSDNSDDTLNGDRIHLHNQEPEVIDARFTDENILKDNKIDTGINVVEKTELENDKKKANLLDKKHAIFETMHKDCKYYDETVPDQNNKTEEEIFSDKGVEKEQCLQTSTDAELRQTLMELGCFQHNDLSDISDSDNVSCDSDDEYFEETVDDSYPNDEVIGFNKHATNINEQGINEGEYRECLNSTAYIFVPTSSIVVSGTMTPDNIDTDNSTDDEPESPNMSSYGSGIKVSQYTSGDSESTESESGTNAYEVNSDRDIIKQNNRSSSEQHDLNGKEKGHMRFRSPLDFSCFDANKDPMVDKSPRSPRVLGRHYMEMDDEEKITCTSPPVIAESEPTRGGKHADFDSKKDSNLSSRKLSKSYDISNPDIEDSFQTVQFHIRENDYENGISQNLKIMSPVSSDSGSDQNDHGIDTTDLTNIRTIDHDLYNKNRPEKCIADREPRAVNNEYEFDGKISNPKRSRRAAAPVKIKIANLKRKVSSRNKIKPGYVKQVSQLFLDGGTHGQDECRIKHDHASSPLPFSVYRNTETLMPREEIEIFQDMSAADGSEDNGTEQHDGEIIVTPLIQEEDDLQDDNWYATTSFSTTNLPDANQTELDKYNHLKGYNEEHSDYRSNGVEGTCSIQKEVFSHNNDNGHETIPQQSLDDTPNSCTGSPELKKRKINETEHIAASEIEFSVIQNKSTTADIASSYESEMAERENKEPVTDNASKMISSLGFETSDIELSQMCAVMSKHIFENKDISDDEHSEMDENCTSESDTSDQTESPCQSSIEQINSNIIKDENEMKICGHSETENENMEELNQEMFRKDDRTSCLEHKQMIQSKNSGSELVEPDGSTNSTTKKVNCNEKNVSVVTKENEKVTESANTRFNMQPSSTSGNDFIKGQAFTKRQEVTFQESLTHGICHGNTREIHEKNKVEYSCTIPNEVDSDRLSEGDPLSYMHAPTNSQCVISATAVDKRLLSFSEHITDQDAWSSIVDQINKFKAATPSFFHKAGASESYAKNEAPEVPNVMVQYSHNESFLDSRITSDAQNSNASEATTTFQTYSNTSCVSDHHDDTWDKVLLEGYNSEIFTNGDNKSNDELSDLELCMFTEEANDVVTNIFQHTCYDVRKPITAESKLHKSTLSQSDYSSQARLKNDTVNNTNANHSNTLLPVAKCNDASCDNGVFHFPLPACQSVGETNFVQVDSRCCIVNSENIDVTLRNTEGGDKLTNECYRQNEGVHIPRRLTANKNTHQTLAMNYGTAANVNSDYDTRFHVTRINGNHLGGTQDVFHSRMPRSDISAKKGGSRFSQDTSVGVKTLDTPVLFQSSVYDRIIEDETGKVKGWPYSDIENQDRVPVKIYKTLKKVSLADKKSQKQSDKMRIVQADDRSTDVTDDRTVKKYHSSSVLPANTSEKQLMQSHSESIQEALQTDANGNMLNDEEIAQVLPKLAETITNMKNVNAEEVLPGITQTVAKLKDGGNLVITTMTRKLVEDEEEIAEEVPSHPVVDVDDLENSKIYLVQDSRGEMFYVEDVTSESQESAYFSSSRPASESYSETSSSPSFQRISKIQQVGNSGINEATAEELISAMYDQNGVTEIDEFEDEYSERTYEFDLPKGNRYQDSFPKRDYSKDSFKTSYMVEEPDTSASAAQGGKTTTKDHYESSYQMTTGQPWVFDGAANQYGQQANFSSAMQASSEELERASTLSESDNIYRMQNTVRTTEGNTITTEKYTIEAEAFEYPQPETTVYAAPPAVYVPPPIPALPVSVQTDEQPNYSLVKVDMTPKSLVRKVESPPKQEEEKQERPIYKTVAHIETKERPRPKPIEVDMADTKKYKIVTTKPTPVEEVQESQISLEEVDYRMTTENIEYKLTSPGYESKQYYVKNTSTGAPVPAPERFKSEKRLELSQGPNRQHKTEIQVKDTNDYDTETYEENKYSYDKMVQNIEQTDGNMRVVRGSYMIKNTLDEVDGSLDDNLNLFDGNFTLRKDNPLYQSDEDIYKKFEREKAENARKQQRFERDLNNDITFETVDKFSKSKEVKRDDRPKQSLSQLLLSKLSTIDVKDIRQHIDVKHHSEDIYGDPTLHHADGSLVRQPGTNNFDTVGEKVDLVLKEGKAFITVTVTAERISPLDLEFNVWRKNQAIVTRVIEVDLLATEQRRRLYYQVMEEPGNQSRGSANYRIGPNETVLDSQQTLDLFTKILGAADGEGDKEDITVKTRQMKTTRPFSSGMDMLY